MTRELVITVPHHLTTNTANDQVRHHQGPLDLFRSIFTSLKNSNMDALGEGDFLSLPPDFLGNPYISAGVLIDTDLALKARYANAEKVAFLFRDQAALDQLSNEKTFTIICLYPNEMEVALYSSVVRVLTAIGREQTIYPLVPFYIPERSPVYPTLPVAETSTRHQQFNFDITLKSVLQHFVRLSLFNSTITHIESESKLLLRVDKNSWRQEFGNIIEANEPFALITDWNLNADSTIVWTKFDATPDSEIPAYDFFPSSTTESRLNGCFLLVWPHEELGEDSVIIVEDGFNLLLTMESWAKLRDALSSQGSFSLPLGEQTFELSWT